MSGGREFAGPPAAEATFGPYTASDVASTNERVPVAVAAASAERRHFAAAAQKSFFTRDPPDARRKTMHGLYATGGHVTTTLSPTRARNAVNRNLVEGPSGGGGGIGYVVRGTCRT